MNPIEIALPPFQVVNHQDEASVKLSLGIRNSLLSALSGFMGLKVYAASFDPYEVPTYQGYVIEISFYKTLTKIGGLLCVVKQGEILQTKQLETELKDAQFLENAFLHFISGNLLKARPRSSTNLATTNIGNAAYEKYLLARFHLQHFTPENTRQAIALYQEVMQENPHHHLTLSGLAAALFQQIRYGVLPSTAYQQVREHCEKAIELALDNVEAYTVLALVQMYHDKDFYAAGVSFENALVLRQNYPEVLKEYCWYLLAVANDTGAIQAIDQALEYDPLSTHLLCTKADLLRYMENYTEALLWYQKACKLDKLHSRCIEGQIACYTYLNDRERAYHYLELYNARIENQYWRHRVTGELAVQFNDDNLFAQAEKALLDYQQAHPQTNLSADLMSIYADKKPDLAMEYFREAFQSGVGLVSLLRYPPVKPLKNRKDYQAIIGSLQLNIQPKGLSNDPTRIVHIKSELSERLTLPKALFIYAEADGNYSKIYHPKQGKLIPTLLRINLGKLMEQLDQPTFLRIHNSYILNMDLPDVVLQGNAHKAHLFLTRFDLALPVSRKVYKTLKYLRNTKT